MVSSQSNSINTNKTPPNILIFTDDENEFKKYKSFVQSILGQNAYAIYRLSSDDLINSSLWIPSCAMLITSETFNENHLQAKFTAYMNYLKNGGNILSIPSINENLNREEKKIDHFIRLHVARNKFGFENYYENNMVLDRTPPVLNLSDFSYKFTDSFYYYSNPMDFKGIHFISKVFVEPEDELTNDLLKDIFLNILKVYFNLKKFDSYKSDLENFETYEIYSKNQKLSSSLPNSLENIVVLARQQTNGQGNNKNEWLSPIGCCMFTLYLNLNAQNFSTSRLCLLQFCAALSCVKAITKTSNHQNIPIKIKWPNDIYYDGKTKLGGVLVKSSILGSFINLKIGVGFNISNEHPTECLNRILRERSMPEWSSEVFLAKFINHFEEYVSLLEQSNVESLNKFLIDFQENWLHNNQKVKVNFWNEEVDIIGINEFGYLKVKRQDNTEHYLQPDGNRFDLMQNMIVLR